MLFGNKKTSRRAFIMNKPPLFFYLRDLINIRKEGIELINLYSLNPVKKTDTKPLPIHTEFELVNLYRESFNIPQEVETIIFPDYTSALSVLLFTFMDLNDEIVIPEPLPYSLRGLLDFVGVRPIPIETFISNGFKIPLRDVIEPKITPRMKVLFYSNPQIPTGTIYSQEEMERMLFIAMNYNSLVISDETYRFTTKKDVPSLNNLVKTYPMAISIDTFASYFGSSKIVFINVGNGLSPVIKSFRDSLFSITDKEMSIAAGVVSSSLERIQKAQELLSEKREVIGEIVEDSEELFSMRTEAGVSVVLKLAIDNADNFVNYLLRDFRVDNKTIFALPLSKLLIDGKKGKDLLVIDYYNLSIDELQEGLHLLIKAVESYKKEVR
ncbi:aminotransferase class I/II-fold pyridoxal phosphate-dependent enzyme [candidate division WOR-3 bacterium]|nr:aminotransferase class I/II-fold pyridoxal phosphate-dependent enzyme [candidate division WOR-3 bacterium]